MPTISRTQVDELTAKGAIAGGMLPKLQACFEARSAGVERVCIIDGRVSGSLPHAALAAPGEPIAGTVVL
jgi:acetylglutamate kinase